MEMKTKNIEKIAQEILANSGFIGNLELYE
jgi:hypothetical protein